MDARYELLTSVREETLCERRELKGLYALTKY